jgi:hypothetical protein
MTGSESFSRDAQRYLDGEPHGPLRADERARADALRRAVAAYGGTLGVPAASLEVRVMAAIREAPPPRRSPWAWALEPRTVRLRPIWIPLAAAAALAVWLAAPGRAAREATAPVSAVPATRRDTVFVRFELRAPEARAVAVAGDFTEWRADVIPLSRRPDGTWTATVPLGVGEHRYQFVVDGERWVPDPATEAVEDGFGGRNSVIVVGPKGVVRA